MKKMLKGKTSIALLSGVILLSMFISSCSSAKANQNITPHEITQKVLEELGITAESYRATGEGPDEPAEAIIEEYYSEADEDFTLDRMMMMITFPSSGDEYSVDMLEQYSVISFDKVAKYPFEIVVLKLPQTDGKTDSDLVKKAVEMCNAKLSDLKIFMEPYSADYTSYLNNTQVKTFDNYVYYCMTPEPSNIYKLIEDSLK